MIVSIVLVLAIAIISVAFPLFTYTFTLAAFGFAHVVIELNYINNRFRRRLNSDLRFQIIQILSVIFILRFLQAFGIISSSISIPLELSCVVGLILVILPTLVKKNITYGIFGLILCIALMTGAYMAPTLTLLLFAFLHNMTPVGFIAEKLQGIERKRSMLACFIVFCIILIIIISGLPYKILSSINLVQLEASIIQAGKLENNLAAYIPSQLHNHEIATYAFSAAVFLQCMHYAVVMGILSKLDDENQLTKAHQLTYHQKTFYLIVILISIILFYHLLISFVHTRAIYGIVTALHAWVEIPILLLSLVTPQTNIVR